MPETQAPEDEKKDPRSLTWDKLMQADTEKTESFLRERLPTLTADEKSEYDTTVARLVGSANVEEHTKISPRELLRIKHETLLGILGRKGPGFMPTLRRIRAGVVNALGALLRSPTATVVVPKNGSRQ